MTKAELKFKTITLDALERAIHELLRTDDADEMWRILGRMSDTICENMN